jgi:hypothetical protein
MDLVVVPTLTRALEVKAEYNHAVHHPVFVVPVRCTVVPAVRVLLVRAASLLGPVLLPLRLRHLAASKLRLPAV